MKLEKILLMKNSIFVFILCFFLQGSSKNLLAQIDTTNGFAPEHEMYELSQQLYQLERRADSCISELNNVMAIKYLEEAIQITDALDGFHKSHILSHLAKIHYGMGNDVKAISLMQESMELSEQNGDSLSYAQAIQNIGLVYFYWKDYSRAYQYFQQAKKLFARFGLPEHMSAIHNNIGLYFKETGEKEKALAHLDTAYVLNVENDKFGDASNTLNNIGNIYCGEGDFDKGLEFFKRAMNTKGDDLSDEDVGTYMNNIGRVYGLKGDFKQAFHFLDRAINVAELSGNKKLLIQCLYNHADVCYYQANYKSAVFYYKKYYHLKDSLLSSDRFRTIQELNTIYEVEKKEKQIMDFRNQEKINALNLQKQQYLTFLFLVIGVLFVVLYILLKRNHRTTKNANADLVRRNLEFQREEQRLLKRITVIQDELNNSQQQHNTINESSATPRSKGGALPEEIREDLLKRLIRLMEEEKIYADKTLSLDSVSRQLHSNQKYISQLINEEFHQNFNHFVNSYRVKKAMTLLSDVNNHHTIEATYEEAGFNSKSTFNTAFKKITGVTPSTFRNCVLKEEIQNLAR